MPALPAAGRGPMSTPGEVSCFLLSARTALAYDENAGRDKGLCQCWQFKCQKGRKGRPLSFLSGRNVRRLAMTAHQQLLDVHSNMGLELFKTMCTAFLPSAHIQPYTFPSPGPSWLCGVDSVEVAGCNGQSWGVRVGGVGLWRAHMATT